MNLDEYKRLKAKADRLRSEAERAEGALEQTMGRLERDHGCKTLEEAEALLGKLTDEEADAEAKYEEELGKFKEAWGDKLEKVR